MCWQMVEVTSDVLRRPLVVPWWTLGQGAHKGYWLIGSIPGNSVVLSRMTNQSNQPMRCEDVMMSDARGVTQGE
jgi:hypothetical protein